MTQHGLGEGGWWVVVVVGPSSSWRLLRGAVQAPPVLHPFFGSFLWLPAELLHDEWGGKELFTCFIMDGEQVLSLTEGANVYRFVCLQGTLSGLLSGSGV